MEVKFRIGEQVDKIAGGEVDDPHQSTYPVRGITESGTKIDL